MSGLADSSPRKRQHIRLRLLTARPSLVVHYVYDDGQTVCGHRLDLADVDEGGVRCENCIRIGRAQGLVA